MKTCLTKHQVIKTYPVLNKAPRHEDIMRLTKHHAIKTSCA